MSGMTLDAIGRENSRSAPNNIASICGGSRVTYREFGDRVNCLANALAEDGVEHGDRIVWLGQNCHRWMEALIASASVGAILCSLNWRLRVDEIAPQISELDPKLILWDGAHPLADELRVAGRRARLVAIDGVGDSGYESLILKGTSSQRTSSARAGDPALLLYVPTPDGRPAGSMLTHTSVLATANLMAQLQWIDSTTVNLASAPLFHIAALFTLIPTFMMRGTNVYVGRPQASQLCEAISKHRCTRGYVLAPTVEEMVVLNAAGRFDLSSFQNSLPIPAWQAMTADDPSPWGRRIGGYGQTETGMVVLAALGNDDASSTSGRAAPYVEVRIVDPQDGDVPVDVVGEIVVRGASVHCGYWKRDDLNADRFRNGWWHTNDLGKRLADGTVVFVAPKGRMLKSGAENIYATEVEQCLRTHPAISDVAVIGVPDATWVQSVKAILVLEPDGGKPTVEEIIDHCRRGLASHKKPRFVEFRTEPLPRTATGIDYEALDVEYGGGNYPGEGTRSY